MNKKTFFQRIVWAGFGVCGICCFSGCTTLEKAQKAEVLELQVARLQHQLESMKGGQQAEVDRLLREKDVQAQRLQEANRVIDGLEQQLNERARQIHQVRTETRKELSELELAKRDLERSLARELQEYKAKLEMTERGLVLTFLAEIFFDSGKAVVRPPAKPALKKVAAVLKGHARQSRVAVEGHTDNVPIQQSNWASNWELSAARALAVLNYFIDEAGVDPTRLSVVGYGQYQPVESNATAAGRQQNRRVEIVILPAKIEKVKDAL